MRLPHRLLLVMMLLLLLVLVQHTFEISRDWNKLEQKFKKHLNPFTKGTFLIMVGSGRKRSEVVGNVKKMVGKGQKWVVIKDSGWTWSEVIWG